MSGENTAGNGVMSGESGVMSGVMSSTKATRSQRNNS